MNLKENLEFLGLSGRESRVYLALLGTGPTTTSKLIRKTGIASSKIYDVLEKLEHKGLVTYIINKGKKEFHPSDPDNLSNLIKEKQKTINDILPDLRDLFTKTSEEIVAEIYKGKEGIKSIFEDILRQQKNWYVLGVSGKGETTLPYYLPHFYNKLSKANIKSYLLFIDTETTRKQSKELRKYKNIKSKFLPNQIKNLLVTFIYGDKVVIIPITKTIEIEPLAILIKSKESADSYRNYFDWLWKICRK